jgi:predicted nucleic acid-binding protein
MLVVADATPLHYLVLIGEINLLRELYGSIVVPSAVADELSVSKSPLEVRKWIAAMPEWATVAHVQPPAVLPFESLGLGEREAIALAQHYSGSILLTDDHQARIGAETLDIKVVPTIRVLSTAAAISLVNFDDALRRLQQTNFRVTREVIDKILERLPDK